MVATPEHHGRTKKGRESVYALFVPLFEKHGVVWERTDEPPSPGYSGASIHIDAHLSGVGFMVDIDSMFAKGTEGMVSWFNKIYPVRNFSHAFNVAVGETQIMRPHHKATTFGSWSKVIERVDRGLALAKSDSAFVAPEAK